MSLDWGVIGGIIGGVIFGITAIVFVVLWIIGACRKYRGGEQRHSPGSTGSSLSQMLYSSKYWFK